MKKYGKKYVEASKNIDKINKILPKSHILWYIIYINEDKG